MSYTTLWIIWGIFFAVIEGSAVIKKAPGATLTAHIVQLASLKNKSYGWLARRGALVTFFGWLIYHFAVRTDF